MERVVVGEAESQLKTPIGSIDDLYDKAHTGYMPVTNEEMLQDLKQFIEATVSQQMADVATKDDVSRLDTRMDRIEQNMATKDDVSNLEEHIDTKLDTIQDAIGESFERVEKAQHDSGQRITRLEQRAA